MTTELQKRPLHALLVEDRDDDLLLLMDELERAGYVVTYTRVETVAALEHALTVDLTWDVVLSDFSLPTMNGHDVLRTLARTRPDLPCIVMSGSITEEAAVELLRAGAGDFVVKDRMARLVPAIERELREAAERRRLLAAEAMLDETRDRMQFALEAVQTGFWSWDIDSNTVIWSDVLERLHELQPGTFAGTLSAAIELIHPDDREAARQQFESAIGDARDFRIEYRILRPDGSVRWVAAIGRMFHDPSGTPVRAAGVGMDITTQKALEAQLRQVQKLDSIGNLASGIAHDFNNLITVIAGYCELVGPRVTSDPPTAEAIEAIANAATSAAALTRQLLTFSRAQVVRRRLLDVNHTIRQFGPILRRLVHENITIEWQLSPAPCPASVDPGQLEQLLMNLVANARDAMPRDGTVTIGTSEVTITAGDSSASLHLKPGTYVVLTVRDNGAGMSEEVKTRIFEPFFTTKAVGKGTGLGLATVYGIVTQSDGHIRVESELGRGTAFLIYLPRASESASQPPGIATRPQTPVRGGETVLVVDDNFAVRQFSARLLQQHGYGVLLAGDGEQAQQICREHPGVIDLMITDIVMPGESGPLLAQRIRELRPSIRIIYTSGHPVDALTADGERHAFLPKPFSPSQLTSAVREALASR